MNWTWWRKVWIDRSRKCTAYSRIRTPTTFRLFNNKKRSSAKKTPLFCKLRRNWLRWQKRRTTFRVNYKGRETSYDKLVSILLKQSRELLISRISCCKLKLNLSTARLSGPSANMTGKGYKTSCLSSRRYVASTRWVSFNSDLFIWQIYFGEVGFWGFGDQ